MNKIFKYFMMVVVAISGLSLASCSDDDDNYNVGEASDGAYLYADFSSKTFLPNDEQTFSIKVGRTNTTEAQTIDLKCDNDKFTAPTSVSFQAGQKDVVVPVTCNLELGQTEDAMFTIPTDKASIYGDDTITVSITRDYTWEKIGTAEFTDGAFGYTATIDVMKAKEYSDTQDGKTVSYYKFVSPMTTACKQAGDEEIPGEADFKFYMDEDGNLSQLPDGFYDIETGASVIGYQFYYNTTRYGQYCSFVNDNGDITFTSFLYNGDGSLYGPASWDFVWTDGYPVKKSE